MKLRIAITADPYIPVPPVFYGGIERIVAFLVRGLIARGHEVTLFAHPESHCGARLFGYGIPPHWGGTIRAREAVQLASMLWRGRSRFDVVHSFGRLAALLPLLPLRGLPKVQSYQRPVPWPSVKTAIRLAGQSIAFTGCSASLRSNAPSGLPGDGNWNTIFNGVEMDKYPAPGPLDADAPLVFLGRLERIKGPDLAIEIARRAGRRLVLAGNKADSGHEAAFFDELVRPRIDGDRVTYVGPVDDVGKAALLSRAAALLMPIRWAEPFGIVMAEALACGAPVIGFGLGSVPEVVRDGVNGYVCGDVASAVYAVARLGEIDRAAVRRDCERRFSSAVIVDRYEDLYRSMRSAA